MSVSMVGLTFGAVKVIEATGLKLFGSNTKTTECVRVQCSCGSPIFECEANDVRRGLIRGCAERCDTRTLEQRNSDRAAHRAQQFKESRPKIAPIPTPTRAIQFNSASTTDIGIATFAYAYFMLPVWRVTSSPSGAEWFLKVSDEKWKLDVLERFEEDADIVGIKKFCTALHELEALRVLADKKGGILTLEV